MGFLFQIFISNQKRIFFLLEALFNERFNDNNIFKNYFTGFELTQSIFKRKYEIASAVAAVFFTYFRIRAIFNCLGSPFATVSVFAAALTRPDFVGAVFSRL